MGKGTMGVGRMVSHYRLLEQVGGGGMGLVYKAEDLRLNRFVALKFLPPELTRDELAKRRFVREAQTISALEHSRICGVHEIDETPDGQIFICMPFYDGETLDRRIERGPLPVAEAVQMLEKVAEGLACAHSHDIIHRDLKPSNIMLTRDGEVKVLDFGLAKLRRGATITRSGLAMMGTLAYMSPEQARGDEVDARSDVYSLGVVLYECLTGHPPFRGEHDAVVLYQILNAEPPRASVLRPEIPPALQLVIDRAIAKDASVRYQSAAELRDDLLRASAGSKRRLAWPLRPRLRLAVLLTTVAALLAVGALDPALRHAVVRVLGMAPPDLHVAVLPFESVGEDPDSRAFSDGITEMLTAQLSLIQHSRDYLWVVPASETRERGIATAHDARTCLGVNLAIGGSVQRSGGRIRVSLRLIDAIGAGAVREPNVAAIDTPVTEVLSLQDEVMKRAGAMMNLRLAPEDARLIGAGRTAVASAFTQYLAGLGYARRSGSGDDLDRAIAAFSMAIGNDADYAPAHAGLGETYWRKYRHTNDPRWINLALRSARRAVQVNDELPAAHTILGTVLAGMNDADGAVDEFERALALEPTNWDAVEGLATVHLSSGDVERAEAAYRRLIALKPDCWGPYYELGTFYYNQGEVEKAFTTWTRVVELAPENKYGYENLGVVYWDLAQWRKAREMFERSLAIAPNFRAYAYLGALNYMDADYVEAARMYEKALELNDGSYRIWAGLARAYYWIPGDRDRAMRTYQQAAVKAEDQRKLTPRDAVLLLTLADCCAVLGRNNEAAGLIDEALAISPGNPRVMYMAGHACELLGLRDEALAWIGRALESGYPRSDIEHDPFLHELRKDTRYARMMTAGSRGVEL